MRPSVSPLARAMEPLVAGLWIFFVLASLLVGAVWTFGIGDAQLARWVQNRGLLVTLQLLLEHLDFAWITLAAANVYLSLTDRVGLATARRRGLTIVLTAFVVAWTSVRTGFPLGPIEYGRALGPKLGPVPLGLPLFWFTVIVGASEGLLRFFSRWSHLKIAIGTGLAAALTDANLEPLAAKLRGFWFWRSGTPAIPPIFDAPLTGCLGWGFMAGLLAFALHENKVAASAQRPSWQPVATLIVFNAIFLAAHLGRWVRN